MKLLSFKHLLLFIFIIALGTTFGQDVDKKVVDWYNNKKQGMGTDKAYKYKHLRKNDPDTVVVAIIDSGVDIDHEDLQGKIWVNKGEIPGNGIDDDNNGYVDDVHGWNFLGNKNGENQGHARLEMTRIYAKLRPKYEDKDSSDIAKDEMEEYILYLEVKQKVDSKRSRYESILGQLSKMIDMEDTLKMMVTNMIGADELTEKSLEKFDAKSGQEKQMVRLGEMMINGTFKKEMEKQMEAIQSMVDYHYNVDYDDRSLIGDDYLDMTQTDYGNNDVKGLHATHGTHVGGIVGAVRGNKLGGDGVAANAVLMCVRAVPDGDEFDKDVALAIRYAVDNGADIINASFGKAYSQMPQEVYEAIKYAEDNDVLFVHAAGNSGKNLDDYPNYPANKFPFQDKAFENYLSIGASTRNHDGNLAASFSNYSTTRVDVFAPGFEIYNTVPENKYEKLQGTSMAAPMVSGVAAVLKGYYPDFTMKEIRKIILDSAIDFSDTEQVKPGTDDEMVKFGTLSATGKVVNLREAVKMADERYSERAQ